MEEAFGGYISKWCGLLWFNFTNFEALRQIKDNKIMLKTIRIRDYAHICRVWSFIIMIGHRFNERGVSLIPPTLPYFKFGAFSWMFPFRHGKFKSTTKLISLGVKYCRASHQNPFKDPIIIPVFPHQLFLGCDHVALSPPVAPAHQPISVIFDSPALKSRW